MMSRFLVVFALLFWQGGFVFYSAVVVPVGRAKLNPPSLQSLVTMPVTQILNLTGAAALLVLLVDLVRTSDEDRRRWKIRWGSWLVLFVTHLILFALHPRLSALMGHPDDPSFYPLHRSYLIASTVQWFAAMLFLLLTLTAWRAADRRAGGTAQ